MKIATWNVNSIRVRIDQMQGWLDEHEPDVLCLQETKCIDLEFPLGALEEVGYESHVYGEKSYNGVAICCLDEVRDVVRGFDDGAPEDEQKRLIAGTVHGVRVISAYFPNGHSLESPKYQYKLEWMARLQRYLADKHDPGEPLVLCGDFNVAPEDRDVFDPAAWQGDVLVSKPERDALAALRNWGLHDSFRHVNDESEQYTWWNFRTFGFQKNEGLRIDHHYVTESLLSRVEVVEIDTEARAAKKPSDHAPVTLSLAD